MSNLAVVKSEYFGSVKCDFYENENREVFMTSEQLGKALEYNHLRPIKPAKLRGEQF